MYFHVLKTMRVDLLYYAKEGVIHHTLLILLSSRHVSMPFSRFASAWNVPSMSNLFFFWSSSRTPTYASGAAPDVSLLWLSFTPPGIFPITPCGHSALSNNICGVHFSLPQECQLPKVCLIYFLSFEL